MDIFLLLFWTKKNSAVVIRTYSVRMFLDSMVCSFCITGFKYIYKFRRKLPLASSYIISIKITINKFLSVFAPKKVARFVIYTVLWRFRNFVIQWTFQIRNTICSRLLFAIGRISLCGEMGYEDFPYTREYGFKSNAHYVEMFTI